MKITKLNEWASIDKSFNSRKENHHGDSNNENDDVFIVFFHVELFDKFESF